MKKVDAYKKKRIELFKMKLCGILEPFRDNGASQRLKIGFITLTWMHRSILIISLFTLQDNPLLLIFVQSLAAFLILTIEISYRPWRQKSYTFIVISNGCFLVIQNYHLLYMTNFARDTSVRQNASLSLIVLQSLNIVAVNLLPIPSLCIYRVLRPTLAKLKVFYEQKTFKKR